MDYMRIEDFERDLERYTLHFRCPEELTMIDILDLVRDELDLDMVVGIKKKRRNLFITCTDYNAATDLLELLDQWTPAWLDEKLRAEMPTLKSADSLEHIAFDGFIDVYLSCGLKPVVWLGDSDADDNSAEEEDQEPDDDDHQEVDEDQWKPDDDDNDEEDSSSDE